METEDLLRFTPTERPPWRNWTGAPTTSHMLAQICGFSTEFSKRGKAMVTMGSLETTIAHFVFSVSDIEGEGLPSLSQTEQFCALIAKGVSVQDAVDTHGFDYAAACSTFHMFQATQLLLHKCSSDLVGETPHLDVAFVKRLHETLFSDTAEWSHAGVFRKGSAFTRVSDQQVFTYLNHRKISQELARLLDRTNRLLQDLFASQSQSVDNLLKLGGAFFLMFEEIHPFHDGNGRVGRLLLAYLLSCLTPFGPNLLYVLGPNIKFPVFVDRSVYLGCFQTDDMDRRNPSDITALIIEGVYLAWKHFVDGEMT